MAALTLTMKDVNLERFRDAYTTNQGLEKPATDDQLCQYLVVQASALTYDVEIRRNGGDETAFQPVC